MTDDDDIPPEWVPWFELLRWVIWIARRYHALELDEASVKRLIPDVVLALRHKVDERKEPRLGLWDHGQFVCEIGWLVDYDVDWQTGRTRRVDHLEDDPPYLRDRTFPLAVAWDWLVAAAKQAVKLTRPAQAATPAVAAADESQKTAPTPAAAQPTKVLPHGAPSLEQFLTNKHDQLPLLKQWATARYGQDPLPDREQLLDDSREDYGKLHGVSEATMRRLRKARASEQAKQGGKPTQKP